MLELSGTKWRFFPAAEFEEIAPAWDELNNKLYNSPLLNSQFVSTLLNHFSTDKALIGIFSVEGVPSVMGVFIKKNRLMWETFQPSQAPIGLWMMSSKMDCEEILSRLLSELNGFSLGVGLTQLDPLYITRPNSMNGSIQVLDYIETSKVTVNGSFDDYWQQRGKNLRQNLRRQRNRLARENVEVKLDTVTQADQIEQAIADYGVLEGAGWKSSGGTAIHLDNVQGKFFQEVLKNFADLGQAWVYKYYYDDQIVAIDLCVSQADTIVILKTTFDESIKTSSPAMLMREDAFKQIFEQQQFKNIEFYGRVMDWHTKWTDEMRKMYHINYYRWAFIGRIKKS